MLGCIAKVVGNTIILGLAIVGANVILKKVMTWKDAHDQNPGGRTVHS